MTEQDKNYENPTLEEVTLGAMFHDIGKFAQRAGEENFKLKEMKGLIQKLDVKTGRYSHAHALYTFGVIESIREYLPPKVRYQIVAKLAASHHEPSTIFEKIIQYGDTISAGADRKDYVDTETKDPKKKFYEIPLACIQDTINLTGKTITQRYHVLSPLEPDSIFALENISINQSDYKKLWAQFYTDIKQVRDLEYGNYLNALLSIFERYLWCIPSSTIQEPDISLYDHAVTTTAFSACLFQYLTDKGLLESSQDTLKHHDIAFLFIHGDVSGIQSYIFDLKTTEWNAKLLRARSFEIELVTNQAAQLITDTLKLPRVCVLTNAGGQFLVVAPNSKDAMSRIPKIQEEIEQYFFSKFLGELSLNISEPVGASINDLNQQSFTDLLLKIKNATIVAKHRKFSTILTSASSHILQEEYGKIQQKGAVCPICEQRSGEVIKEQTTLCTSCNRLIKIGEKLPKAKAIKLKEDRSLGIEDIHLLSECPDNPKHQFAFSINDYNAGFGWYHMPYHIPMDEDSIPLTFVELSNRAEGTKKIAMFKADVDNLGAVFSIGLKDRISISRYAALSRTLHYFFSTYLNYFIEKKFSSDIYTVFSGGDDICVIGPWNKILEFGIAIQEEFLKLVGGNPSLTLSAGISLADSSLPIRTLAHETEEALKKSKEADPEMKEKNRITAFQTTVHWSEFKQLMEEALKILTYLQEKTLAPNFFHRLLEYQEMNTSLLKDHTNISRNALWRSHFCYDLARSLGDAKYNPDRSYLKEFVHNNIQKLRIPVSYALYRIRKD